MTRGKKTSVSNRTFLPGYKPARTKYSAKPARLGVKRWLIRAAKDEREVVVIDAINEDEALQRAYSMSATLQTLGVWPALPVLYAEEHGDGPVYISWFREGSFRALEDREAAAS